MLVHILIVGLQRIVGTCARSDYMDICLILVHVLIIGIYV